MICGKGSSTAFLVILQKSMGQHLVAAHFAAQTATHDTYLSNNYNILIKIRISVSPPFRFLYHCNC